MIAYFLLGPPASGKSSWRDAYLAGTSQPTTVISTDDLIEEWANEHGLTYTEAFGKVNFRAIEAEAIERLRDAVSKGNNIIIDRTNMKLKSRNMFHKLIPMTYEKHAVVFDVPRDELQRRLYARAKATGKHIPINVVDDMIAGYAAPQPGEFKSIQKVSS